jgi:hypothetical protein
MNNRQKMIFVAATLLLTVVARLLPHPANFTPVAAMALFGGALVNRKWLSVFAIVLAMGISDILLNSWVYNMPFQLSYFTDTMTVGVYLGILSMVVLGWFFKPSTASHKNLLGFSLSSSLLFWTISNFFCWPGNPLYSQDAGGLIQCYVAALPFLGSVIGELIFCSLFYYAFHFYSKRAIA